MTAHPGRTPPQTGRRLRAICLTVCATALSACTTVGPNFKAPPPPPSGTGYVTAAERLPSNAVVGMTAPEDRWWTEFGSPSLNQTVESAVAGGPTLEAARARLIAAREQVAVVAGGLYPQVSVSGDVSRRKETADVVGLKPSTVPLPPNFNLYEVGASASYLLDLFGGARRAVEAQHALADSRRYELDAAATILAGNTAIRAIQIAGLRAQLAAVEQVLDADRQTLDLVRRERSAGEVSDRDVAAAAAQLAADETQQPPLEQDLSVARHGLAVLVGTSPGALTVSDFDLSEFHLPGRLPVSVPSELVHRRPDIQAAEARLHAASAQIGVATAKLYPQISLSAGFTASSLNGSGLFSPGDSAWSLAGSLLQPVFDGGARRAERREAIAEFQATTADYRQTVLLAFAQVGDSLTALDHDADLLAAQKRALDLASESLRLERINYATGAAGVLTVLDAQRQLERASLGYAQVQGQLYLDTVQLIVAMGGGKWTGSAEAPQERAPVAEGQLDRRTGAGA